MDVRKKQEDLERKKNCPAKRTNMEKLLNDENGLELIKETSHQEFLGITL